MMWELWAIVIRSIIVLRNIPFSIMINASIQTEVSKKLSLGTLE